MKAFVHRFIALALAKSLAMAFLGLLLGGCGNLFQTAGGSSDTDNAIALTGEVLAPDGQPAPAALVQLRRDDYLSPFPAFGKRSASSRVVTPISLIDLRTDSLGRFRIDSVDTGGYFLEARIGDTLAALFRASSPPGRKTVALGARTLEPMASVTGTVLFRVGTYRVFVQAYGLERMVPVDMTTGRFRIRLPAGRFDLRFVDPERARAFTKIREVTVVPGQALEIDPVVLGDSSEPFFAWRHSAELLLNTTSSGAGTSAEIRGFPLLIRLDSSNFDFSQALPGGADLRFSKPDGRTSLAHEIERWDPTAGRAEIWVRMDTVQGNRHNQGVYMYWGNADALDASDGAAVFDTVQDHSAVWHLGEAGGNDSGGYRDATGHANRGTGVALGDTSSAPGVIGKALALNGRDQFIRVPNSASLRFGRGNFTLSAWVRLESLTGKRQVLSKRLEPGRNYELQVNADGRASAFPGGAANGAEGFRSNGKLATGIWHHLAFVREAGRTLLYLDGVRDAVLSLAADDVDSNGELHIGQDVHLSAERWHGLLDEVRIASRAHGIDWIKLSYQNQSPGSQVLEWRRFP